MQNFNYHSHTYRCRHADLDYSDEDYIKEYIKNGIKKIAITDHAPEKRKIDKRLNMRMDYYEKDEYLESINKLRIKYKDKISIESGFEIEYLPFEEDNIFELKNECDKLILGQHFIYDDDYNLKIFGKTTFTDKEIIRYKDYLVKAMELSIPNIIAHPDIFMYNRTFSKVEEDITREICKSCIKYNIPLEINLNNIYYRVFRNKTSSIDNNFNTVVYPNKDFWKIVSEYNVKVLYGIDAHHKGQISLFNELVSIANTIIGEDTINKLNFIDNMEEI